MCGSDRVWSTTDDCPCLRVGLSDRESIPFAKDAFERPKYRRCTSRSTRYLERAVLEVLYWLEGSQPVVVAQSYLQSVSKSGNRLLLLDHGDK